MKSTLFVIASTATSVHAFWRMECPGRVVTAQIDPIVNPDATAAHMHSVYGSSGFSKTSSFSELQGGSCTSCRVTEDKSAYWTPSMYFKDASTGEYSLVTEGGGLLAYYFLNGENITAFPEGFKMLAGNTTRRTFNGDAYADDSDKSDWAAEGITSQADLAERAIGFNCLNYAKAGEATLARHYFPDKAFFDANCPNGLRVEMMFPSCWDGVNIDSTNHQDHVAYPSLVMTGDCPSTHPYRLPGLMYETHFSTYDWADESGSFVFSNNDTTGFGYHGDFIAGWDTDVLQSAVDTCTNESGLITDCSVFNVIDKATATSCSIDSVDSSLVAATTAISALPMSTSSGNVVSAIVSGFNSLTSAIGAGLSGSTATSASASTTSVATSTSAAVAIAAVTTSSEVPTSTSSSTSTTPAPVTTSSVDPNAGLYYSTEWVTGANGAVTEILWEQEVVTATEWLDVTTTVTATATGVARR